MTTTRTTTPEAAAILTRLYGATPHTLINPTSTYEAHGIEGYRKPLVHMFAICSGQDALRMIARSENPHTLLFVLLPTPTTPENASN